MNHPRRKAPPETTASIWVLAMLAAISVGVASSGVQQTVASEAAGPRKGKPDEAAGGRRAEGRAGQAGRKRREKPQQPAGEFRTDVPAQAFDLILARPTDKSVTFSVRAQQDCEGCIAYGTEPGRHTQTTPSQTCQTGQPVEFGLGSLQPNTRYYYEFRSRKSAATAFAGGAESTFHTARPPGSSFTFTVTADSHLDENTDLAVYRQTMVNALADTPDFHIDLGDTFMSEKHPSRESAAKQYLAQRYYFGLLSHSAPLYLVLGNHDGESGRYLDGTADNLAVWANGQRKKFFPNPSPDGFYTGNPTPNRFAGPLQDYYAWEWGDALVVVLDPFWFELRQRGGDDNWRRTLGADQYQWLRRTLQQSRARFKLVFIHHLVGGADKQSRGGAEVAGFYEWGGRNADGSEGFRAHRPGWPAPIHQVLLETGVSVVFHGHDHLFAKQDLDGIIYQEVPQPGLRRYQTPRNAEEYGYLQGQILGGPGHLRIAVSPALLTVAFVNSSLPEDETADRRNRAVRFAYEKRPQEPFPPKPTGNGS